MFTTQHTWCLSEVTNTTADLLLHGYSKKQGLSHESTFSSRIIQTWMQHYTNIKLINQIKNSKPFESYKSDIFCVQGFKFYIELVPNTTIQKLKSYTSNINIINPNFHTLDLKTIESGKVATFSSDDTFSTPYLDIPEPDANEEINELTPSLATYSDTETDSECNMNFIAGAYYDIESDNMGFNELSKSSIFGDYGRLTLSQSHFSEESIHLFDNNNNNNNNQSYFEIYIHIISISPNISNINGIANIILREKNIKIKCEFNLNNTQTWFQWTEGNGWNDENYLKFNDIYSLENMTFDIEMPNELNITLTNEIERENEIKNINYFPLYRYTDPFLLNLGQFNWKIISKQCELNYKSDSFTMNSIFTFNLQFDIETLDVRLNLVYLPENVSCVYIMYTILFKDIINEKYFKFEQDRLISDGWDDNVMDKLDNIDIELLNEWYFSVEIQLIDVYNINGKTIKNKYDILVENELDENYMYQYVIDKQHIFLKSYDDLTFLKSCNDIQLMENVDKFCLLI